jgi:hypothetical protein
MKATMLVGQISISAFFVFCLASADALDASDNARMDNLVRKAIQLRQDVLNVQSGGSHGGNAGECLNELSHNLETSPGAGWGTDTVASSKLSALGMPTGRDFRRISRDVIMVEGPLVCVFYLRDIVRNREDLCRHRTSPSLELKPENFPR